MDDLTRPGRNWSRLPDGITACFEDRVVRVQADQALRAVLKRGRSSTHALAQTLIDTYQQQIGKSLQISRTSLVAEIRIHAFLDRWFLLFERIFAWIPPLRRLFHALHVHTYQIDCGERSADNNRFIFDLLAPLFGR